MDRTGSLGGNIHPREHVVRITFIPSNTQQQNASPSTPKSIQAHASFKRAVLVPDENGYLPQYSHQPQFWFMKLTLPKGLPLYKGTSVDGIRLKPDGRQFGSDGCKEALKEVSSISLKHCHYAWLEDPDIIISHRWDRSRYPEWVTTADLLRRVCNDFVSRFTYHTSYMREPKDAWSWIGEPKLMLTDSVKIVQFYVSYTLRSVMVVLANHPGHLARDIGEDSMITAIDQRMKDLRGWVYDQRIDSAE